ncbi:MAG: valine--tRNA ligase, partial [Planctomycetota bacterium]|nr:valine--tRNA ligase [Planctomycetota bacterium]
EIEMLACGGEAPAGSVKRVAGRFDLYLPAVPKEKLDAERDKLRKEIERIGAYAEKLKAKLSDEKFLGRAPAAVVEADRKRLEEAERDLQSLREHMAELGNG